ncbi:hypothetical protein J6590_029743 [Homalodisca vitripennis]|nr:hypothetical protein J6590_029743 [Homalodisca vitripennis]
MNLYENNFYYRKKLLSITSTRDKTVLLQSHHQVEAITLRRRNYKVRRYGVIASREDVEMTPLENEDDDEDSTVFDISMKTHTRS